LKEKWQKSFKTLSPSLTDIYFSMSCDSGVNAEDSRHLYTIYIQYVYKCYNHLDQYGQVSNPSVIEWSMIQGPWHAGTLFERTSRFSVRFRGRVGGRRVHIRT